MAGHDLIVIGSSAGGVETLMRLCQGLPADLRAAVLIVQHVSPSSHSVLPQLLSRAGPLPAKHPDNGEKLRPGMIYVAPPDLHMLVDGETVVLRRGPYENRTRPAINPLFRSAAVAAGPRVAGVVLSGMLDDGTSGLIAIKLCGGVSIVQDPADAAWAEMPRNAARGDSPDHVVPLAAMGSTLAEVARSPAGPAVPIPEHLVIETRLALKEVTVPADVAKIGDPTTLSCPQCGGVLNEAKAPGATRFRCQVGHAFTPPGLRSAQNDELERALFTAERMYCDRAALFRRMLERSEASAQMHAAERWRSAIKDAERSMQVIRDAVERLRGGDEEGA